MDIQKNISLKPYNTFSLDVKADLFTEVKSLDELQDVVKSEVFKEQKVLILGGGSNVLLTDDFHGLVVKIGIKGIEKLEEDEKFVWLQVGAGENWHELVLYTINNNYGGLENLSLIPGTVGAAPMQNIGAYGVEIKDVFAYLEAVNIESGMVEIFDNKACKFGYRESIFKNIARDNYIIGRVILRLSKADHKIHTSYGAIKNVLAEKNIGSPSIKDVSEAVISIRQSKLPDPSKIGNAGSFFKNPVIPTSQLEKLKLQYPEMPSYPVDDQNIKVPAGWLIEQCGWKGKRRGDIGVHKMQSLVLVNHGGGKGQELLQLAKDIQQSVKEKFNIELSPEVNFV